MTCYAPNEDQHTGKCAAGLYVAAERKWMTCNRPAKFHVHFGTGCAHMCGIHARKQSINRAGTVLTPLAPLTKEVRP